MGLFNIFRKKQPDNRKYPAQSEQKSAVVEDKTKPEYWLNELRTRYLSENSTGREQINEALLTFGDSVYPQVRNYLFSLACEASHDLSRVLPTACLAAGSPFGVRTASPPYSLSSAVTLPQQ